MIEAQSLVERLANDSDFRKRLRAQTHPYKSYVAKISQAGTAAPTVGTELENTLTAAGTAPTLARTSIGLYTVVLTGAFPTTKTYVSVMGQGGAGTSNRAFSYVNTDISTLTFHFADLATPSAADSLNFDLEIRVYE